jgi:hypothetical protein
VVYKIFAMETDKEAKKDAIEAKRANKQAKKSQTKKAR